MPIGLDRGAAVAEDPADGGTQVPSRRRIARIVAKQGARELPCEVVFVAFLSPMADVD